VTLDPMDVPPIVDHGADRYDYVEVQAPLGIEPGGAWWEHLVVTPCMDCRANVFARWKWTNLPPSDRRAWHVVIAHDDGCPNPAVTS
jgi:hypothetical protein